jgi:Fic family protein
MFKLLSYLKDEMQAKRRGGLYHKTQINLAYNSNRIEGSRLTEEQTRCIFETRTIGFKDEEAVSVDDIIETSNHFVAFDYLFDTVELALSNDIIKEFHKIIKAGTSDASKSWFRAGDWKKAPNEVGDIQTTLPQDVENEMNNLNNWYNSNACHCGFDPQSPEYTKSAFDEIMEYHYRFEKIHPFQDGNGRVGRLIMFRECLRNGIVPFIIDERHKQFYYRGLREFENVREYLTDTCLSSQDNYIQWIKYFYPELIK